MAEWAEWRMVDFVNNIETAKIGEIVERHFIRRSWKVEHKRRVEQPVVEVSKRDILFSIRAIDTDMLKFISISDLLDRMENFSREYRATTGEVIIFVARRPLIGLKPDALSERSIAFCLMDNLDSLTDIEAYYDKPFSTVDGHDKTIIRGCRTFCIAMSDKAIARKDFGEAQRWLELSIDGVFKVMEARYKLFDLFLLTKNVEAARDVARGGLAVSGHDLRFLKRLRALEQNAGNAEEVAALETRIATASEVAPSLESILAKQRENQPQPTSSPVASSAGDKGFFRDLLNRLQRQG